MNKPAFRRMLRELTEGKVIVPIIRAALSNPTFTGFEVPVEGWIPRPYDGWFHPSTHATWTDRQLTYYLTHGAKVPAEQPDLLFVLSVTQGKFWHEFIQRILLQKGIMVRKEVPLRDEIHNRTGHTDGELESGRLFEFKTASERVIRKMTSVEDLKEYKPGYYAQTQDYLDMAGAEEMHYFIMQLSAPFAMEEFIVPADPEFQAAQRAKYRRAIEAAQSGTLPNACCAIGSAESKGCPVRNFCPIGAMTK